MPEIEFKCPPPMVPHVQKILQGEYDVGYAPPDPVIIDIGANVGGFALWAVRRWPGCEIHCYEPVPETFEYLRHNVGVLKGAGAPNRIHLNNIAIGDPARSRMFIGRNNCGENSFFQLGEQTTDSVDVVTRSPAVLPRADLLKLDAEGSEIEILAGLPQIAFEIVMVEYHSEANRRRIDTLLADYSLVGGEARCVDRGILKYAHNRLARPPAAHSSNG